jgi:hypothetical protein
VPGIEGGSTQPPGIDCDESSEKIDGSKPAVDGAYTVVCSRPLESSRRIVMFASLRAWQLTSTPRSRVGACLLLVCALACGGGKKEPSVAEALAQSDKKAEEAKKAKEAADKKLAEAAKKAKEGVLEHPWTFDEVKASLVIGTALAYEMSGKNAKGKTVSDRLLGEVKGSSDTDVKVLQYKESQKGDPAVTQPQGYAWDKLSPFFHVERSETKVLRTESVQVPAGTFDCVVADVTGFFGNSYTVWMIVDKPGIYAQVVEHPNAGAATEGKGKDQTEITYKLASLEHKG